MSEKIENVLNMQNITMQFGGVVAVNDLSLEVNRGDSGPSSAPTAPARPRPSTASPASTSRPTARSASRASP